MFCWHKYPKWSDPEAERWTGQNTMLGALVGDVFRFIRYKQDRTCEKCHKYQIRYVDCL